MILALPTVAGEAGNWFVWKYTRTHNTPLS